MCGLELNTKVISKQIQDKKTSFYFRYIADTGESLKFQECMDFRMETVFKGHSHWQRGEASDQPATLYLTDI